MTDQKDNPYDETSSDLPTSEAGSTTWNFDPQTVTGTLLDNRFLIEKNLTETGADKGGMGIVYLARDQKLLGRKVVVKILAKGLGPDPELARKFEHEKESLIRLDHPNVVRLLDAGSLSNGDPFLVMEYIAGRSLRAVMNEMPRMPLEFVSHVVRSLTSALAAAHANGIFHRDVKPENIMLTPQNGHPDLVRLIDFGVARVEQSQLAPVTVTARAIGTPRYMAPEQLTGGRHTAASDIYALGLVVFEMLVGNPPFQPRTIVELHRMQQEGVKALPPDAAVVSDETERILLSALEYHVSARPQDARVFGDALCRSLGDDVSRSWEGKTIPATQYADSPLLPPDETQPSIPTIVQPSISRSATSWLKFSIAAALVLAVLAITAAVLVTKTLRSSGVAASDERGGPGDAQPNSVNSTSPSIRYFLEVQKMRGRDPVGDPFKSSGRMAFQSGYKFTMHLLPDSDGFVYLFNEGIGKDNVTYFILYPTPSTNGGSAAVFTDRPVTTAGNEFKYGRGTEVVWLIWTRERSEDLEFVRRAAFSESGEVRGEESLERLRSFVQNNSAVTSTVEVDSAANETIIRGAGDVIVHRIELEHK